MSRVSIDLPEKFSFSTQIPIRITDLNYGNHVGNDTILSLAHEARVQFLKHHGFEELNAGGVGLIMADAAIQFKTEIFYGDTITAFVAATGFSKIGFDVIYKLEKTAEDGTVKTAAIIKTGMVCFDYDAKKIVAVPEIVKQKLESS